MSLPEQMRARCSEDCDCLIWQGATDRGGRPRMSIKRNRVCKTVQPRRVLWEAAKGPIQGKKRVTMTCGNPLCLNVEHMKLVTPGEVISRTAARPDVRAKRRLAGLKSRDRSPLDMEKAEYIRTSEKTLAEVAQELGVCQTTASAIRRGKRWTDSTNPFAALL